MTDYQVTGATVADAYRRLKEMFPAETSYELIDVDWERPLRQQPAHITVRRKD